MSSVNGDNPIEDTESLKEKKGRKFGERHKQCMLIFFGIGAGYTLQTNLSLGIVPMTDRNSSNPDFDDFEWDEKIKSLVLSAFFWGYGLTQVPSGRLAQRYGAKLPMLYSILVPALLNILTPWSISFGGWPVLLALRIIQGMFQGAIFPSIHTLLAKWAPVHERSFLGILAYSGSQFGTVISLFTSGLIAESWLGWPCLFYIWGLLALIWCALWYKYGVSSPAQHKSITMDEREFIEYRDDQKGDSVAINRNLPTPWKSILSSLPFIGLFISHCSHAWGFWIFLSIIPTYLCGFLGLDIRENGFLSAVPYLGMFICSFIFYFLSHLLRIRGMSLETNRKLFNTIGLMIPGLAVLGLAYATTVSAAIALITLAVSANAGTYFGFYVNHIDLAPNFAGIMMGISNSMAVVSGILSVLVVGVVVTDETSSEQWRIIFLSTAAIYIFGSLSFLIYGKANTQPWDELNMKKDDDNKT